ncbi:hypothetical protein Pla108_04490 [Botrimarina colliarenosi]|uniref:Carboxypeptidase regulatory-like domain-containing protein n=1 Tax=Botrimarina colliarenosi TaxID=2528001 RepID=A0A5C6AJC9_9BACT|nr:CehA/McbA family metallohydrolase [Botrimarina colliarenosi]TWT99510.1 hypothetical protein Pla108_04490 [Botrimarina colliarenosi]
MTSRLFLVAIAASAASWSIAAELIQLDATNYDAAVPAGKETDAIYGDFLLRNDQIIAVIAAPGDERDANLTVRNVGGSVIDLTERDAPNDQLSCFYAGGGGYAYDQRIEWPTAWDAVAEGSQAIAFAGDATGPKASPLAIQTGYELRDGEAFVRVTSMLTNTGDEPVEATPSDGVRADTDFKFGVDHEANLWWAYDLPWRQAYGVQPESGTAQIDRKVNRDRRSPNPILYPEDRDDPQPVMLAPGESVTWRRRLFPAASNVALQTLAYENRGESLRDAVVTVTDGDTPIEGARVRVIRTPADGAPGERISLGIGLTDGAGRFEFALPAGDYALRVSELAHGSAKATIALGGEQTTAETTVTLAPAGFAEAVITDGAGRPIPAKVQLTGVGETKSPDFGPESGERGVKNVQYTPDGRFRCKLAPGAYKWVASYGPEYDAAYGEIVVDAAQTARIAASLPHTVDTTGWLSSELHSHSSPSGDNTASQAGRVLNLLAEHLEFCPCTEHARIDVYDEHLEAFDAQHRMLTCPGMELTGQPLPLNHQNAFPLVHRPHEQDGGGPQTDANPVTQIKRLAEWDNGAEKVIQTNHPNTAQMIGDRDLNGEPDEGFEAMFGYMDVMEVHPPELIFEPLGQPGDVNNGVGSGGWDGRGSVIQNWLQMLNLGYRVTGVVNTDAHYNFHGSGWMRNWVHSATDVPAEASVADLVHEFEHGHVVVSNGPFMQVTARSAAQDRVALPGDDLRAADGKATFRVVVRCPNWIEINRVQLFVNGRPDPEHNYTVRSHGDWFGRGPEVFDREIEVALDGDAHVVVACCGEGRSLKPMFGGDDVKDSWGREMPVAVANPIFLDTDGDADGDGIVFEPNGDDLGLPLPSPAGRKPSHGHDHPNHRR